MAVTDAGIRLDDHLVLDGVGLTGRELSLSVFGVAGRAGTLRALELLAQRLDLVMTNIVSAWQALAAMVPYAEAIVLDVGLSGTDVCLIHHHCLIAAGWIPLGGEFFTNTLAQAIEFEPAEAKELTHALIAGELSQREVAYVEARLEPAGQRWYKTVMDLLADFSTGNSLPWKVYLTGGGSLLPGLDRFFRSDPTPFNRAPEVARLGHHLSPHIKNLTEGLNYELFSLALSLTIGLPD